MDEESIVVETGGIGYHIYTTGQTFRYLPSVGEEVKDYGKGILDILVAVLPCAWVYADYGYRLAHEFAEIGRASCRERV